MIQLNNSIKIKEKDALTIIKMGFEMPIDDYKKLDISVDEYPLDAWEVWALKYHDTDHPTFEVCNKGLRVAINLSKEEKAMIMEFLTEQGYERMLQKENDDAFQ
jgi:hypothetical protein